MLNLEKENIKNLFAQFKTLSSLYIYTCINFPLANMCILEIL